MTSTEMTYIAAGFAITARLYRPEQAGARPAILLCPGRLRDISGLEFLSTALAARGYIVLATTYRGMDFFSDDADARAGLDYLAALPEVDSRRLGIVGHSRGGMTGLRTAAQDERVRALVALAPPTEFTSYVRAMALLSPMRYEKMIESMGGTPEAQPERYRQISALSYAAQIHCPVLLVCGTQDLHAPIDHSKWMYEALVEAGNTHCRLEILEGVGHFFEKMYFGYQFEQVAELTAAWFDRTLLAKADD
jgi:dipeptidyl aminopeptidase/acylaminoacyl peptidase